MSRGDVTSAYDAWAPTYDTTPNRTRDLDGEWIRADLVGPLGDVVEPGCGTGRNTAALVHRARSWVGLDASEGMLARARAAAPSARFARVDLGSPWPVPDASADLVVVDLVLEHVAALDHVAREAARVLRPGGRWRLSELHPERQRAGAGAHFHLDGVRVDVPAVVHRTEEYLRAALDAGFVLRGLREALDRDDAPADPPRLLILDLTLPSDRR